MSEKTKIEIQLAIVRFKLRVLRFIGKLLGLGDDNDKRDTEHRT